MLRQEAFARITVKKFMRLGFHLKDQIAETALKIQKRDVPSSLCAVRGV